MDEDEGGTDPVETVMRPDWGGWSARRAFGWTLAGSVLVVVLAGFALGGLAPPGMPVLDVEDGTADSSFSTPDVATPDIDRRPTTEMPAGTRSTPAPRSWETFETVVVFRNDDIQPGYRTETMHAVDRIFVEENVPVTLGVVPNVGGEGPIGDSDVCSYLRSRMYDHPEIFEVALHGYTHERRTEFHGGSEFGGLDETRQQALIADGTEVLTDCVGERPASFVPPMDTYDATTVETLRDANYTVVSGAGWFTGQYYNRTGLFEQGGLVHASNSGGFVANWTTNEFHDSATLERRFDWVVDDEGLYVQMLHYQDFYTEERREQLRDLIRYMKTSGDVRFMTLGELGGHVKAGTLTRTDDGWRVYR